MHFQVRLATEDDLAAILEIYNESVHNGTATFDTKARSWKEQVEWFKHHPPSIHPVFVAETEGRIAGWGSLSSYRPRAAYKHTVEYSVYIHHEFRRQGVGRILLKQLLDSAAALGHRSVVGVISGTNAASLAMCKNFGFREVGIVKDAGFKHNQWLDIVIVQRMCAVPTVGTTLPPD